MKITELLQKGIVLLEGKPTAVLDCEILLSFVLGVGREYLIAHGEEAVGKEVVMLFLNYVEKVGQGFPVAYILQEREFFGLRFFVDERVLVPRPETELLVEMVLEYVRKNNEIGKRFRMLDIGTGSGNMAVSVAKSSDGDRGSIEEIDAIDVCEGACEVAKINVLQHGVEDIVKVFQSDLLEIVEKGTKYNVIMANLPYIGKRKFRHIDSCVEKFEPKKALFAGDDGMDLYKRLFQQLIEKEVAFDMLVGEFGFGQGNEFEKLLDKYFEQRWGIEKDLEGRDRMFVVASIPGVV